MQHPLNQALQAALDERDHHTGEHCDRVGALCLAIAADIGLEPSEIELLRQSAALHDLGKIGIPDMVLRKPGSLDRGEWDVMRSHSDRGARIIAAARLHRALELAVVLRHHHEHVDGSGYPDGLRGSQIPLLSRIIAVVDSYDAMTVRRSYRDALSHAMAMEIMRDERGTKLDPAIFDLFEPLIEASPLRPDLH